MLTASNPSEFPELLVVAGGAEDEVVDGGAEDEAGAVTPEDCDTCDDCCEDSEEATLSDWLDIADAETAELAASVLLGWGTST